MTVHILKLCVGVDRLEQLQMYQSQRLAARRKAKEAEELYHMTRHVPRRAEEVTAGGSLYWVIKGHIQVRQPIIRIDILDPPVDMKRCAFVLGPVLVETEWQARRPHQGWRYLRPEDAPADRPVQRHPEEGTAPPPEMLAELKSLGLV